MARDRLTRTAGACPCGGGSVEEHWSENDYPFMTRLDRSLDRVAIDCGQCSSKFVVVDQVANPSPGSNHYFVTKDEAARCAQPARAYAAQARSWSSERQAVVAPIGRRLRDTRRELQARAEGAGAGLEPKYRSVGILLGFPSLDEFRAEVGRTRPKTWVPRLLTSAVLEDVLRRMGRESDALTVGEQQRKLSEIDGRKPIEPARVLPRTEVPPLEASE